MTKERLHAMIQYYDALGAWYMVKTLRGILAGMLVMLLVIPAHAEEFWRVGNHLYSNTGKSWVLLDGDIYDDTTGELIMSRYEAEKTRRTHIVKGISVTSPDGTLCLTEGNHAICHTPTN